MPSRMPFGTFEEYVEARREWSRSYAFRIIESAELAQRVMLPIGDIPNRESHIRPLLERLENDHYAASRRSRATRQASLTKLSTSDSSRACGVL